MGTVPVRFIPYDVRGDETYDDARMRIAAQIVSFFINRDKTFNSDAKVSITLPIYIIFTIFLICFSAWLAPTFQGFLVSKNLNAELATFISNALCGAIQFFLYFPVDKLLFKKKKEA